MRRRTWSTSARISGDPIVAANARRCRWSPGRVVARSIDTPRGDVVTACPAWHRGQREIAVEQHPRRALRARDRHRGHQRRRDRPLETWHAPAPASRGSRSRLRRRRRAQATHRDRDRSSLPRTGPPSNTSRAIILARAPAPPAEAIVLDPAFFGAIDEVARRQEHGARKVMIASHDQRHRLRRDRVSAAGALTLRITEMPATAIACRIERTDVAARAFGPACLHPPCDQRGIRIDVDQGDEARPRSRRAGSASSPRAAGARRRASTPRSRRQSRRARHRARS